MTCPKQTPDKNARSGTRKKCARRVAAYKVYLLWNYVLRTATAFGLGLRDLALLFSVI